MKNGIDLEKIGRDIYKFRDVPGELDGINLKLAGWYSYYSAQMIPLEDEEATFWEEHKGLDREKPVSDAMVKALWRITPNGHKMTEISRILKCIEKDMSTLRTSIARADREMRSMS